MHILIAPDSFKGTAEAPEVAGCIADGWRQVRPADRVTLLPMADGGEGSAATIGRSVHRSREISCTTTGPDGRAVNASWWLLLDGTAVVELAAASGLPLMAEPDPLGAQTCGFGELLAAAARHPDTTRIVAAVGGSASTDGGAGALAALGAAFLGADGAPVPTGGRGLALLERVDVSGLLSPPDGGVQVLTDVTAPLLGVMGAAAVFGPQKGANNDDVTTLDAGLARLAELIGGDPDGRGAGAAGGTAYGLATLWDAELVPGARRIGELVGLPDAVDGADLVITGEGRFDGQSTTGKVVGHLVELATAAATRLALVAGDIDGPVPDAIGQSVSLVSLAGGSAAAMADTRRYLAAAGAELARWYDATVAG